MEAHTLELEYDSTLDSVDSAEEAVLQEAAPLAFDEDELHRIGIAVRECMVNAVVHGNRYNGKKRVRMQLSRDAHSLSIRIADEGEGFDPAAVPDPGGEENLLKQSGRGVMMMNAFMDQVEISPGVPRGTVVKMVKYKTSTNP